MPGLTGRSTRTRSGIAPRSVLVSVRLAAQCRCVPVNSDVRPRNGASPHFLDLICGHGSGRRRVLADCMDARLVHARTDRAAHAHVGDWSICNLDNPRKMVGGASGPRGACLGQLRACPARSYAGLLDLRGICPMMPGRQRSNRSFDTDAPRRPFASLQSSSLVAGQLRR
jgi:hypothetical protein